MSGGVLVVVGNITPDVEEVIWLYDQTLERMDSGFRVYLQLL